MRISDDQIDEFITTWESAFNERLTRDDAKTKAAELLELFTLLSNRPLGEGGPALPGREGCSVAATLNHIANGA